MRTKHSLNNYEKGIVNCLVNNYNFSQNDANQVVIQYLGVIRELGGYDNCESFAERLISAVNNGHSPTMWLKHIQRVNRDRNRDQAIPLPEEESEYAHI